MQGLMKQLDPQQLAMLVVEWVPKILLALLVFAIFWALVRLTRPTLKAILRRADFAEPLIHLLVDNLWRYTILIVGLVMAAQQLEVDVAAALAGIGVAGIALGFAAQDSLANTIAGFLIFWDKPFQVGQFITTQGHYGEVANITMRTTRIRTRNNTYVVIPNKNIIDDVLVNHSLYGETRVDIPLGIAYKEDIRRAREVLLEAARSIQGVLQKPQPSVVVSELGASSINMIVRVWIREADRERPVFYRTLEACKLALDEAAIQIPFPHLQLFVEDVEDRVWQKAVRLQAG